MNNLSMLIFNRRNFSKILEKLQKKVLIETSELAQLMKEEPQRLSIINASIRKPDYEPKSDHSKSRIPGSVYFDIESMSDPQSPFEYMIPPKDILSFYM